MTAPNPKKALLLLHEDTPMAELLAHAMRRAHFDPLPLSSPEDALAFLENSHKNTQLVVLTNLTDNDLKSSQLLARLKTIRANLPVVLFSAHAEKPVLINLLLYENVAILQRPLQIPQVMDVLHYFQRHYLGYPGPENRKYRRVDLKTRVGLTGYNEGIVENISAGGMMVHVKESIPAGTTLNILLPAIENTPISGLVVWDRKAVDPSNPGIQLSTLGIRFSGLHQTHLALLSRFIFKQLRGTPLNPQD